MPDPELQPASPIRELAAKIITAYVRSNPVQPDQLPSLISTAHEALGRLGKPVEPAQVQTPAVPIRRSVQRDAVVCLDCGWKGKMLRRHLTTRHGLSGEQDRQRWRLTSKHPLTAPIYSEARSTLAKQFGLGNRRRRRAAAPVSGTTQPRRRRSRAAGPS